MASFTDAKGRTHHLAITFGQVVGELKAAGLDLAATDYDALARVLYGDPFALVRVVKVLAPGADFDGAGRDVLDTASAALEAAVTDFSLRPAARNRPPTDPPGGSPNPSGGPPVSSA